MDTSRHARLAQRLPFYYGWVVFEIVMGTNYNVPRNLDSELG